MPIICRYYKNSVSQEEGWNDEMISWCQKEAERQNLKPEEYWGGLLMDEMKIQVYVWQIYYPSAIHVTSHTIIPKNIYLYYEVKTIKFYFPGRFTDDC